MRIKPPVLASRGLFADMDSPRRLAEMDPIRRHLLKAAGLVVATRAFADDPPGASMQPSSVKPRHVLCFLGMNENLLQPPKAVAKTIADFGFEIDRTHSQARPDANMTR